MSGLTELPARFDTRFTAVRFVEETGSTNADLLAEALDGGPEGLVLVTDHQTAGRGRQRRTWHDEPGNALLVSILLRPARALAPLVPLLTGVAAVDAIATMGDAATADGPLPVGLKWPNDVLAPALDERKLAGILAESSTAASAGRADTQAVVTGMGMNLRWASPPPPEVAAGAATLTEVLGRPVDRDDVLDRYLGAFELWLRRVEADGIGGLLARYRQVCLTLGRQVRFVTASAEHVGMALDVSPSGTLLLDTSASGTEEREVIELHAGDAHHVP